MKRWLCLAVALVGLTLAGIGIYRIACGEEKGESLVAFGLFVTVMVIVNLPTKEAKEHKPQQPHPKP